MIRTSLAGIYITSTTVGFLYSRFWSITPVCVALTALKPDRGVTGTHITGTTVGFSHCWLFYSWSRFTTPVCVALTARQPGRGVCRRVGFHSWAAGQAWCLVFAPSGPSQIVAVGCMQHDPAWSVTFLLHATGGQACCPVCAQSCPSQTAAVGCMQMSATLIVTFFLRVSFDKVCCLVRTLRVNPR
eukprot:1161383-Pelagomonas_calceolata.AAC.7